MLLAAKLKLISTTKIHYNVQKVGGWGGGGGGGEGGGVKPMFKKCPTGCPKKDWTPFDIFGQSGH